MINYEMQHWQRSVVSSPSLLSYLTNSATVYDLAVEFVATRLHNRFVELKSENLGLANQFNEVLGELDKAEMSVMHDVDKFLEMLRADLVDELGRVNVNINSVTFNGAGTLEDVSVMVE